MLYRNSDFASMGARSKCLVTTNCFLVLRVATRRPTELFVGHTVARILFQLQFVHELISYRGTDKFIVGLVNTFYCKMLSWKLRNSINIVRSVSSFNTLILQTAGRTYLPSRLTYLYGSLLTSRGVVSYILVFLDVFIKAS